VTFLPPTRDELFSACFRRVYRFGRRWDEGLWRFHELSAVLRLLEACPGLRDGPILDLGCGDDEVFQWLFGTRTDADAVDSGSTWVADVELARRAMCYREVRLENAASISFEDGRFALVFSNSVLEHIRPVDPVIREAARVLRPGGHLLFTTPDPFLYSADAYAWRRLLQPVGLDFVGQGIAQKECTANQRVCVLSEAEWRAKLEAAGLSEVDRIEYFPCNVARSTSTFSGAARLPLLRRIVEFVTPLARELSKAECDEAEWVSLCRRVLAPLLDADPGCRGCGQLILAEKPRGTKSIGAVSLPSREDETPRRKRILWVCRHRIARFEEVGALLRSGAEVIPVAGELQEFPNAVQIKEEEDPLYPRWRPSCSIPSEVVQALREYDYFRTPNQPDREIVRLLDRFIDIVWVGTFSPVAVGLLRAYRGTVVLRTYGGYPYTAALGPWPMREPALQLLASSDRFVFCPSLPYQGLVEDPRLAKGETYWPACVTASRLGHVWAGRESEPFACETISLIERYRRQVYERYVANFGALPLRIFGQNAVGGPSHDPRVIGTLPDDAYNQAIASCRLMLYAGLGTKYHLHYHVLEAMAMGVPVVFFDTSALAHVCLFAGLPRRELRALGMCASVAEARALSTRLLQSPEAASELSARQDSIRSIFQPAAWDGVVANLVGQIGQRARYRSQYADPTDRPPESNLHRLATTTMSAAQEAGRALLRLVGK
jgi:SAM-dependent methyltransferase